MRPRLPRGSGKLQLEVLGANVTYTPRKQLPALMEVQQTLVWLRRDLRVTDNPALYMAAARGGPVIPVYVWAPEDEGDWSPGSAAKWWLERSLAAFDCSLRNLDSRLVLRRG